MKSRDATVNANRRLAISPDRLAATVRPLFPASCSVAAERRATDLTGLTTQEASAVQKAVPERQGEFAAGRIAARRALMRIGVRSPEILVGTDRAPQWPHGTIGSISHAGDLAVAVVAPLSAIAAIGVDIEIDAAVQAELWPLLFSPDEQRWIASRPVSEQRHWATTLFSAKEAFYKFQYPLTGRWLDFTDVEINASGDAFTLTVLEPPIPLLAGEFRGSMTRVEGLTVTAIFQLAAGI